MGTLLRARALRRAKLVEAPGTAPGSAALIPHGVYRHSRLPDDIYIGLRRGNRKGQEALWSRRGRAVNLRFTIFDSGPPGISMPLSAEQQAEVDALADATQPTRRATVAALEEILYKPLPVLDHGFVRVIDYMGDDAAIVQAARVSYGKGTKKVSEDRGLINYLLRHRHTTPFEMCEIKFHVKLPIFVARQWIRHRTANVNEYSARYSILDREFYIPAPEHLAAQSEKNRQGRGEVLAGDEAAEVLDMLRDDAARNYDHYAAMLNEDAEGHPVDTGKRGLA